MEKPILFNTEMVQVILELIKKSTRRLIKGYIPNDAIWGYTMFTPNHCISCRGTFEGKYGEKFFKLPYEKGDILYVRETWCKATDGTYRYKAAINEDTEKIRKAFGVKWHPSIHMPKEAARIFLKVTDVKVQRLQDITEEGAKSEGASKAFYDNYSYRTLHDTELDNYKDGFIEIWNYCYKWPQCWEANPWVWVIEFERVA